MNQHPRSSEFVHFVHGTSRKTPCERAYLLGERNSINIRDVTCATCLNHPLGADALAQAMEVALGGNPAPPQGPFHRKVMDDGSVYMAGPSHYIGDLDMPFNALERTSNHE